MAQNFHLSLHLRDSAIELVSSGGFRLARLLGQLELVSQRGNYRGLLSLGFLLCQSDCGVIVQDRFVLPLTLQYT